MSGEEEIFGSPGQTYSTPGPSQLGRRNPVDAFVNEIIKAKHYLNQTHVDQLMAVFPQKATISSTPVTKESLTLESQLENMMKVLERMQFATKTSEDVTELKGVMASATALFNLVSKNNKSIDAEKKMASIEDAIIESFDGMDEELKKKFLEILKAKLEKVPG
jgi:hypothetical protein